MLLNKNLVEAFDSRAKMAVAKYIIKPGFMMSGRELAKLCGVSHSWAISILKEFEDINFISSRRVGKTVIWTAKTNSYAYYTAEKLFGSGQMFKPITQLKNMIKEGLKNEPVKKAVIFGSVAGETEEASSDIDLFVQTGTISEKKRVEKVLKGISTRCGEIFGNVLHFYILTANEFKQKRGLVLVKNIEKGITII
jgi:predicted nucleotidyltransferase